MKGLLKAIIDEKGNPSYPISVADAIYVNAETTLAQKLKEIDTGLGMYVIDIERFGIVTGFPSKPYSLLDYEKANANITGINRALHWASTQGFTTVVLPKGEYSLCYPQQITLKSNMTLNLNGSKLKVMYDSDNRSPFDKRAETEPTWKFDGIAFMFREAQNAHLMNGEIIGDMYERTFADPQERWVEHTYGVSFGFSSSYCSVTHCKIHGFAGDNVNFIAGSTVRGGFNTGGILGDIDNKGVFTAGVTGKTTTIVTPMLTIPDGDFELWGISGQGYSRTTKLLNKYIDVFYYTEKDEFIGVLTGQKVHTHMSIPKNAKKYRMKFFGETDVNKNFDIFMDWGYHIHHNLVEFNELFNGHRGGITPGGSYNVIQNNMIRDNGKLVNTFLDGAPSFPDATRYAINQEDSYGNNNLIQNNVISGGFHGILSGVYSTFIKDNVFHNLSGTAIVIYGTQFASITGNYIESGGIALSGTTLSSASVQITNNYIRGKVDVSNGSYRSMVRNNHIVDGQIVSNLYAHVENNTIESTVQGGGFSISGANFNNNLFLSGWGGNELTIKGNHTMKNNRFAGWLITVNETTANALLTFKDCSFVACTIRNHTPNKQKIVLEECEITNTQLTPIAINSPQKAVTYEVKNSKVLSTNLTSFVLPNVNVVNAASVSIENTYFEIRTDTFASVIGTGFEVAGTFSVLKKNTFEYTGTTASKEIKYFAKETSVAAPTYVVDNLAKNMTMAPMSYMIAKFDPDTTRKMWVNPDVNGKAVLVHNLGTMTPSLFFTDAQGYVVGPRVRILDENTIEVESGVTSEATIKR